MGARQAATTEAARPETFSHEALLYGGLDEFTGGTSAYIRDGLDAGEAVLVVVDTTKIAALEKELGADAHLVRFENMRDIGSNPARIIPAWRDFVNEHAPSGRAFRGIGEPISSGQSAAALVECQRHESLLNLAFDGSPAWRLLCPYDTDVLPHEVIEEAFRSHPTISSDGTEIRSDSYRDLSTVAAPFDLPLSPPAVEPEVATFELGNLSDVRTFVGTRALNHGLDPHRAADLVLALNEIATNSLRHGGGRGTLRLWRENGSLICEISDTGRIDRPLLGRERPSPGSTSGLGVWLANQLVDLVQIRTFPDGSVVRIYMSVE